MYVMIYMFDNIKKLPYNFEILVHAINKIFIFIFVMYYLVYNIVSIFIIYVCIHLQY